MSIYFEIENLSYFFTEKFNVKYVIFTYPLLLFLCPKTLYHVYLSRLGET